MTTAIDSNILVALWNEDDSLNTLARSALDDAFGRGGLVIAAPVFAELLAAPSRNAHAVENGFRLLTMDHRLYRAAFPHLPIVTV